MIKMLNINWIVLPIYLKSNLRLFHNYFILFVKLFDGLFRISNPAEKRKEKADGGLAVEGKMDSSIFR